MDEHQYFTFFSYSSLHAAASDLFGKLIDKWAFLSLAIGAIALYKIARSSSWCSRSCTATTTAATAGSDALSRRSNLGIAKRDFTLEELRLYDGCTSSNARSKPSTSSATAGAAAEKRAEVEEIADDCLPAYVSVKGRVYDTYSHPSGKALYGPGGSYHLFAGKDVTCSVARMSLDPIEVNQPPTAWANLTEQEKRTLEDWVSRFNAKYASVGFLVYNQPAENAVIYALYAEERHAAGLPCKQSCSK